MIQIFWKDIKMFLSDKKAFFLSYLLPIILVTFFALAFGGVSSVEKKNPPIKLLISDQDNSNLSVNIKNKLDSLSNINAVPVTFEEGEKLVKKGKAPAMLVIPYGLSSAVNNDDAPKIKIYYDQSQEYQVGLLQQALSTQLFSLVGQNNVENKVIAQIKTKYAKLAPTELNEILKQVKTNFNESDMNLDSSSGFELVKVVKDKKKSWGLIQSVAGVAVMMLLFAVSAIGSSILSEKEDGTLKRLISSPLNAFALLYGKLLYTIVVAISQLIVLFLFAWIAFGLDIWINIPALIIMIIFTAIACGSFGIFIASIGRTRKQVEGLSTIIVLVMSAIGGSMIPYFIMPAFMQKISVFSVNYWSIQGFIDIFWREAGMAEVLVRAGVLLLISIVMMLLSYFFFGKTLKRIQ
ncbi:MAG: ABC transporter permease [Hyphomicrobiales bacterium]